MDSGADLPFLYLIDIIRISFENRSNLCLKNESNQYDGFLLEKRMAILRIV